jgi:hypothetical protein
MVKTRTTSNVCQFRKGLFQRKSAVILSSRKACRLGTMRRFEKVESAYPESNRFPPLISRATDNGGERSTSVLPFWLRETIVAAVPKHLTRNQ